MAARKKTTTRAKKIEAPDTPMSLIAEIWEKYDLGPALNGRLERFASNPLLSPPPCLLGRDETYAVEAEKFRSDPYYRDTLELGLVRASPDEPYVVVLDRYGDELYLTIGCHESMGSEEEARKHWTTKEFKNRYGVARPYVDPIIKWTAEVARNLGLKW